ncbi:hypothetical protein LJC34_06935 [Oscillospiraceae bacterium OttesenSCG-928-G22]|nr:hypothetical protein [Oscillospiraceae bacterium OttesenSCG-928-G22]
MNRDPITVLVAERGKPCYTAQVEPRLMAMGELIGGKADMTWYPGRVQYVFLQRDDPGDFEPEELSRLLPNGAVVGTFIAAAYNHKTGAFESLTEDELHQTAALLDAPECMIYDEPAPTAEPTMEVLP